MISMKTEMAYICLASFKVVAARTFADLAR
jgi:hypothetical protein